MKPSVQPPDTVGACGIGLRLLIGLLPCLVIASPSLAADPRWPIRSRPYLAVLGSSPLRIQEAVSPPNSNVHPPAGAPPQPATVGSPTASTPSEASPSPETSPPVPLPSATENATSPKPEDKPVKSVPAILPDDTRPKVKAEDFLPFFQPPGANSNPNDVTVAPTPPAPGVLPPSSATYRQQ